MKKLFPLTHPKIQPARLVDSIRAEMNKYIKRERNKKLPDDVDFWDFDCKVGGSMETAKDTHVSALSKGISDILDAGNDAVYLEINSKPAKRTKKPSA